MSSEYQYEFDDDVAAEEIRKKKDYGKTADYDQQGDTVDTVNDNSDNKSLAPTMTSKADIEDLDDNDIPCMTNLERESNHVQAGVFPITVGVNNNSSNAPNLTSDSDADSDHDNRIQRYHDFVELEAELVTDNYHARSSTNHDIIIRATNVKAEPIFSETQQQRYSKRTIALIVIGVILLSATTGTVFAAVLFKHFEKIEVESEQDENDHLPVSDNVVRLTKHAILFRVENDCSQVYSSNVADMGSNSSRSYNKTFEEEDLVSGFKTFIQCGNRNDTNRNNVIWNYYATNGILCNTTDNDTLECHIRLQSEHVDEKNTTNDLVDAKNGTIFFSCGSSNSVVGNNDEPIASVIIPASRGIGCVSGGGKRSITLSLSRLCHEKGSISKTTWRSVTNSSDFTTCPIGDEQSRYNTTFNSSTSSNGLDICQANAFCSESNCNMNEFKNVDYWDDHSCDFRPDLSSKTNKDDLITLLEKELGFL